MNKIILDYSEYSGITPDLVVNEISNFQNLVKDDLNFFTNRAEFYRKSISYIYSIFNLEFNLDKQKMINKYITFSPQMIDIIINSNYKSIIDIGSGVGLFPEVIKELKPSLDVTYCDLYSKTAQFAIWRYNKYKLNINTILIDSFFNYNEKYDIVMMDGVIQCLEKSYQEYYLNISSSILNPDGLLSLFVDLSGYNVDYPINYNVDINYLHDLLEKLNMICIYGRNTFSSLWKKII